MPIPHTPQDLQAGISVTVQTKYGPLRGGRATNGAAVLLGNTLMSRSRVYLPHHYLLRVEIPYALPPVRFQDPQPLPENYQYENKLYIFETKRNPHLSCLVHTAYLCVRLLSTQQQWASSRYVCTKRLF